MKLFFHRNLSWVWLEVLLLAVVVMVWCGACCNAFELHHPKSIMSWKRSSLHHKFSLQRIKSIHSKKSRFSPVHMQSEEEDWSAEDSSWRRDLQQSAIDDSIQQSEKVNDETEENESNKEDDEDVKGMYKEFDEVLRKASMGMDAIDPDGAKELHGIGKQFQHKVKPNVLQFRSYATQALQLIYTDEGNYKLTPILELMEKAYEFNGCNQDVDPEINHLGKKVRVKSQPFPQRGILLYLAEDYQNAFEQFDHDITRLEEHQTMRANELRLWRGACLQHLGKHEEAVASFDADGSRSNIPMMFDTGFMNRTLALFSNTYSLENYLECIVDPERAEDDEWSFYGNFYLALYFEARKEYDMMEAFISIAKHHPKLRNKADMWYHIPKMLFVHRKKYFQDDHKDQTAASNSDELNPAERWISGKANIRVNRKGMII